MAHSERVTGHRAFTSTIVRRSSFWLRSRSATASDRLRSPLRRPLWNAVPFSAPRCSAPAPSPSPAASGRTPPSPPPHRTPLAAKRFDGGEGCHHASDTVWFTTKGDNRVWQVNLANSSTYELAYDDSLVSPGPAPLTGVDNVTGSGSGDLYVTEDGGNMEICVITPDDTISPFLRINGQSSSEITGPAFTPAGDRLYFPSQRGTSGSSLGTGGITYCVTGPFRT